MVGKRDLSLVFSSLHCNYRCWWCYTDCFCGIWFVIFYSSILSDLANQNRCLCAPGWSTAIYAFVRISLIHSGTSLTVIRIQVQRISRNGPHGHGRQLYLLLHERALARSIAYLFPGDATHNGWLAVRLPYPASSSPYSLSLTSPVRRRQRNPHRPSHLRFPLPQHFLIPSNPNYSLPLTLRLLHRYDHTPTRR
jgi:hypothetical protein